MVSIPEIVRGQAWTNDGTDQIQRRNRLCRCDDCLTGARSRSTVHNAVCSSRSALRFAMQPLTLVVACTTTFSGGGRSDRPAPEETPGAPFAFKDSMIH